MAVGKQRHPDERRYFYPDLMLPVLLDSLRGGWQANELVRPLVKLKAMDSNGLLRRTLIAWFRHNVQPTPTSRAVYSPQHAGIPLKPHFRNDRPEFGQL